MISLALSKSAIILLRGLGGPPIQPACGRLRVEKIGRRIKRGPQVIPRAP